MEFNAGGPIVRIEMHAHLVPEEGETGAQLVERAVAAGYTVLKVEDDGRVLIAYTSEEPS